jgi:hypothetical protein
MSGRNSVRQALLSARVGLVRQLRDDQIGPAVVIIVSNGDTHAVIAFRGVRKSRLFGHISEGAVGFWRYSRFQYFGSRREKKSTLPFGDGMCPPFTTRMSSKPSLL